MMEWIITGTFAPVAMLFIWVIYTDWSIRKQHEEREDDE